jgi:spore coat protein U-like protein
MPGASGGLITYELHQDSRRARRWDNTVTGTENYVVQTTTVYGRVANQAALGTYTITASIAYESPGIGAKRVRSD